MCYTTLGFCHIFNAYNKCSPCGIIIFYSCLDRLTLVTGQYANATLTITPPASTQSGTDVTLTIDAQSSNGVDSNYAVLRLSVVTKVSQWNKQKRFWTYPHKLLVLIKSWMLTVLSHMSNTSFFFSRLQILFSHYVKWLACRITNALMICPSVDISSGGSQLTLQMETELG